MFNIREAMAKRAEKVAAARALLDAASAAVRDLTAEEQSSYDKLVGEADSINKDIERRTKLVEMEGVQVRTTGESPLLGLSGAEIQRFSVLRAVRALVDRDWKGAEFEKEVSDAAAQRSGKSARGFFIPWDVMAEGAVRATEARTLAIGTSADGGYLKPTETLPMIEMLRSKLVLRAAGARTLGGLVGDVAIPRQSAGGTGYWVAELGTLTVSTPTLEQVSLVPKELGAYTELSRKFVKQTSVDAENFVREDLAYVLAKEIDRVGLHGTGAGNQPTGVAGTSGIGSVTIGTDGGAITYAKVVALETEVTQDDAEGEAMAYITNSKVRGALKQIFTNATYGEIPLWTADGMLNGYRALVSSVVSSSLTKASGSSLSAVFFGNWADVIIAQWGDMDVLVNPYALDTAGGVRISAFMDVNIGIRHPQAFAACLEVSTA